VETKLNRKRVSALKSAGQRKRLATYTFLNFFANEKRREENLLLFFFFYANKNHLKKIKNILENYCILHIIHDNIKNVVKNRYNLVIEILIIYEPLAQSVEHLTFNQRVEGSSPSWLTIFNSVWPLGQAVKTPPFHGGNTGSNPVGVIGTWLIIK
jgi:hypothetical protein